MVFLISASMFLLFSMNLCIAQNDSTKQKATTSEECKTATVNLGVAKVSVTECKKDNGDGTETKTLKACSEKGVSVKGTGASDEKCVTQTKTEPKKDGKK